MARRQRPKASPYPQGSAFNSPAVMQAYAALGKLQQAKAGVGLSANIRPNGSAFSNPKVIRALEALQQALGSTDQQGVGLSNNVRPNGSAFGDPKVQKALEGLQGMQTDQQGVGLSNNVRPNGSAFGDPKVQKALEGLKQEESQGAVGLSHNVRPTSSAFSDPKVADALTKLGQTRMDGDVGQSIFKHSGGSALEDPSVARAVDSLAKVDLGAVGRSDFKRPTGSTFDDTRVEQGVQALGQMQGQIKQQGLGVEEYARPSSSNINAKTAPQIEQLPQAAKENGALYFAHNALNGGEISPEMLARYDQPRYQTGCEYLLNMIPMPQGGITKRPGMEYIGNGGDTSTVTKSRILPFVFSSSQSRIMEFWATGDNNISMLRIWFPDGTYADNVLRDQGKWRITGAQLSGIQIAQSADVVYVAHSSHKPGKICRYDDDDWRYEEINFLPSIEAPELLTLEATGEISDSNKNQGERWYDYKITAVNEETGEESLPSEWTEASHIKTYNLSGTWGIKITWSEVDGADHYRIYKKEAGVFGFIGMSEGTQAEFIDFNITPDTEDTPPTAEDPFIGSGNYPSVVFLHQQRLGFAATRKKPLTIWMSQAGNYESMAKSIPPEDDDAIEVTLAANQANQIVWCQSDRNALAVGTSGGEWVLKATEDAALTPSDLSFQPQTSHGSQINSMPVIRAGSNLLYMQRGGKVVREFGYSFNSDKYESGDLTLLARHLTEWTTIKYWAWQAEPYGILWCVLSNGTLIALTYMREHDVVAWHRHETAGKVIDVACIPGSDGLTQVWFLVERNGKRYVERLAPFFRGSRQGNASDAVHVDGLDHVTFNARCIPCLPETQIGHGNSFLHVRKINAVKARVINSSPFKARVGTEKIMTVPVRGASYTNDHRDWALPLASGWGEDKRLQLIFDGPDPVTVLGIVTTVELADMAGGQK